MRSFLNLLAPALAAASPLVLPMASADLPDDAEIQIRSVKWSGNGCPQDSVSASISPDKTVVTFGFDSFQTYIGGGASIRDRSKNCQLHLDLMYPSGFTFSVVDATYHGFAILEPGIVGTFYSTYYFSQDAGATTTTQTSIYGGGVWEYGQVYTKTDSIPTASLIWAPCGASGILNINNRISLRNEDRSNYPDSQGSITDDDATIAFTQQLNIQWMECR